MTRLFRGIVGSLVLLGLALPTALHAGELKGELKSPLLRESTVLQAVATGETTLSRGARGDAVRSVQLGLLAVGEPLTDFGASGAFGNETVGTLKGFQQAQGLDPTGRLDRDSLLALDRSLVQSPLEGAAVLALLLDTDPLLRQVAAGSETIGRGARGAHLRAVQQALISLGYKLPEGGADGAWGRGSEAALRRFQQEHLGPMTGVIDRPTLLAIDRLLGGLYDPQTKLCEPNPCLAPNRTVCTEHDGLVFCLCDPGYELGADGWCLADRKLLGTPCKQDQECGAYRCVDSKCMRGVDQPCTTNEECGDLLCANNKCARIIGQGCKSDEECSTGVCYNERCSATVNSSCNNDEECGAYACRNGKCR